MNEIHELTIGIVLIALLIVACSFQEQSFFLTGTQKRQTVVASTQNSQNP